MAIPNTINPSIYPSTINSSIFPSINPNFEMVVKSDNAGTSNNDQFTIPLRTGETYDFTVTYDGTSTSHSADTDLTLTFPSGAGTYTISISGTFAGTQFNDGGDKSKLLDVSNCGDPQWTSVEDAFSGCENLVWTATDAPGLSLATTLREAFKNCVLFNGDLSGWDVSTITVMRNLFQGASIFNSDITGWDVSNVTTFLDTFNNADAFNQAIGVWDTSSAVEMQSMFRNCAVFNQDLSSWDTSGVTNFKNMFRAAVSFDQDISSWDVTSLTAADDMFASSAFSTTNYDLLLVGWEAQAVNNNVPFHAGNAQYSAGEADSGTTDATTANKLEDSTQNFLTTVSIGDIILNTTDTTFAKVTAVDSDTVLSLSADIMISGEAYSVQGSAAAKAHFALIDDHSWIITDGGPV